IYVMVTKKPINRRNFLKYFTGGLLGAGLVPMVGKEDPDVATMIDFEGNEYPVVIEPIDWDMARKELAEFFKIVKLQG
ncbi:hypothetical protein LCGC14_2163910, partial [marine sediment metagenome]